MTAPAGYDKNGHLIRPVATHDAALQAILDQEAALLKAARVAATKTTKGRRA